MRGELVSVASASHVFCVSSTIGPVAIGEGGAGGEAGGGGGSAGGEGRDGGEGAKGGSGGADGGRH